MVAGKRQLIALWYYRRSVAEILLVSCQTVSPTSPSFVTPQSFHLLGFHALIQPLQPFAEPHTARIPHPYVSSLIISILFVIIYPRQVQPGDHIAPYIAFGLLCMVWPMTCQNLDPSPESNGLMNTTHLNSEENQLISWRVGNWLVWPCVDNNCGR